MSVVAKKDPEKQRKLMMCCATNYLLCDAKDRQDHGLHGGAAFCKLHIPSDRWAVASLDENNAFSFLLMPQWFWMYCAAPPILAGKVWSLLPAALKAKI